MAVYEQDRYLMPVDYIISEYIREYDITKANINILLYKEFISEEQYWYLYNMPKEQRAITVGCMQRDNQKLNKALQEGFKEARRMFCEANDIQDYEILSIKKDAIFLIKKIASHTKFGNIEFLEKNLYTSFYRLGDLELYYYYNTTTETEKLDIKGMSNNTIELHRQYMLDLLTYIFGTAQERSSKEVVSLLLDLRDKYITGQLGVEYYREFNNRSLYRTKINICGKRMYLTSLSNNIMAKDIDPAYNLTLLQELYKIFVGLYLRTQRI